MNSGKAFGILKTEIEDDSSDINYIRSKFAWPFCYFEPKTNFFFVIKNAMISKPGYD